MLNLLDIAIQFATFMCVVALVMLGQRGLFSVLAVRRRLGSTPRDASAARGPILRVDTVSNRFLRWVQSVTADGDPREGQKLRRDLAMSGFQHPAAPIWYVILRFSLAIGLPALLILGSNLAGKPLTGLGRIVFPLALCGLGLLGPRLFIDARAGRRREQMEQEFPDALDLLVVCVEAGLGLESAFLRVAQEVRESHPRIAQEFGAMSDEMSAGKGRADALRAMADRVNVDAVKSFVALLIQTEALGVSIAQSLRTYSTEMRQTRYLKAEEKAMRIPVLMTVPIVVCFMPVMIVALMLPPMIDVVRTIGPAMNHTSSFDAPARR